MPASEESEQGRDAPALFVLWIVLTNEIPRPAETTARPV